MAEQDKLLRVVIIDDSVVFRMSMYKVLSSFPEVGDVSMASGGNAGFDRVNSHGADLVFCDIEMPLEDGDGITTLQRLKKHVPDVGVVMISSMNENLARKTIHSLFLGAVEFIPKPSGETQQENDRYLRKMLRPIVSLFSTRKYVASVVKPQSSDEGVTKKIFPPARSIEAVCIGSSTGGPQALMKIIPELPADLQVPVFIIQHMHSSFTGSLSEYLAEMSQLPIKIAEENETVKGGTVYLAPGHTHLELAQAAGGYKFVYAETAQATFAKPSIDVFFKSAASVLKGGTISVILSGMGRDGTQGVQALKEKGSTCLVLDSKTAIIDGLSRSIIEAGYSDEVLPDTQIGKRIVELT